MIRSDVAAFTVLLATTLPLPAEEVLYLVPETIDSTGRTEVSTELMNWLATLPAATKERPATVRFTKGGTYWVDYTIILQKSAEGSIPGAMWRDLPPFSLDHFRFDLHGATIEQRTTIPYRRGGKVVDERKRWGNPIISTQGATNIQIDGGTLRGSCATCEYKPQYEEWTGIRITGNPRTNLVENIMVRNMTIEKVFGDYVYLASGTTAGSHLKNVRIEDNIMRVAGRQGIVLNGGTGVLIKGNTFGETARFLFDSEPTVAQGWSDVTIDSNVGTSGKLGFFQFSGPKAVVAEKLTITNNVLKGGHFKIRLHNGNPDQLRSGFTFANNRAVDNGRDPFGGEKKSAVLIEVTRWQDIVITGNSDYFRLVGETPIHRALQFHGVERVRISDNQWKNAIDHR